MSREEEDSIARACARFQEKLESCENNLDFAEIWTDSLDELSEIAKAFKLDKADKLHGKTILDIGTYGVKPLYIALKYEPSKIIGIDEKLSSYAKDIEINSKLFVKPEIKFYPCSFFNDEKLKEIKNSEDISKFDFVLLSKTLHHMRTGECIAKERDPEYECKENEESCNERDQKHICRDDEKCCIYRFDEKKIFKSLLELGARLIVYECFSPGKDADKVKGRGGYFTTKEWKKILGYLAYNYKAELIQPLRCSINKEELKKVITKLRQVDCICFYVEEVKE